MYPEPCWWTWSQAPWTLSALAPSARSFGLTTLCLVSPRHGSQAWKPPCSFRFQMFSENSPPQAPQPSGGGGQGSQGCVGDMQATVGAQGRHLIQWQEVGVGKEGFLHENSSSATSCILRILIEHLLHATFYCIPWGYP